MTHLPYILASYIIFGVIAVALALTVQFRLQRAIARLQKIDPRAPKPGEPA
jgi:hypothetical protein